ncbi:hypothetical protein TIFTF001_036090 [Ficus carica]|uniref:Disease resistance N-terminal domain-containing protein n=1 Tax=Ficus carica TaxID=3494 RepID=A0AA88J760_FICCA|nr:hypothetical protein TIFTF001_036022 [Ficus carica]GMN66963.1 hypothetical protein TIFTF001_036026 [Ficus carica]GMN67022.1 hypothetical protein TIFTF001_036086 [Ficus carica]GMN67027.1 hypothetical protein TIFTF001_036090 [Ficus carica]
MADLVAGAIVSRLINALFDRLTSQEVRSLFQGKKGTSKQLDELTSRLQLTNKLLNDSEVKQLKDEDVKKLLDDLKVLAYEADQAMDKINTEALRRKGEDDEQSRIARLTHSATVIGG